MQELQDIQASSADAIAVCQFADFGLRDYDSVWQLQKTFVEKRLNDETPDIVLLGEHPPVITLGRGTKAENLLNPEIPMVEIERGGDVTFHGPGQLIAYPILKLPAGRRDLHRYLRDLEEVLILTLADFDLTGTRNPGWTGAWVETANGPRKIASIGVAVKKWVTYHGIALNVSTDLNYYSQINPCGLESAVMTSLEKLRGDAVNMPSVKAAFVKNFQRVFG